ncbi:cytochrome C oxidase subunit IV family protein [Mycolicibacterium farcinogenes]|uniref:cytochrome C oxidase subunit IV family protein n=1 Tax=Mycolicibacterium farcinogenes TaxID=1802 RepID=UPI001C8E24F2|nr:cytochrome C oxidase subunit IV family protein [Mycolicibacterium farcinogenes]QZH58325.1 cytochrome C oxidase subunit IV family protein [Mycolicibacterium farcinogenes]
MSSVAQHFRLKSTTTLAWIILCVLTIASWWLSPAHSTHVPTPSPAIAVAVCILGAVKGRLIIRHFMEVNTAPQWLRRATDGWLLMLWLGVLAIYFY